MATGFQHLHSYFAYLVLIVLIVVIIYSYMGYSGKKPFTKQAKQFSLIGLIFAHIQLVFGLILYFISTKGIQALSAETMKVSEARLYALEHPLMMIIGIALMTIGYMKSKKQSSDAGKYRMIWIYYLIGLILILLRIPWTDWL